jgi:hypothetical protein
MTYARITLTFSTKELIQLSEPNFNFSSIFLYHMKSNSWTMEQSILDTNAGKQLFKLPQMSN